MAEVEGVVVGVDLGVETPVGQPIYYRFLGDGSEYHSGIPAKDLTLEEVERLDKERQHLLLASPLYEKVSVATAIQISQKKGKKGGE